MQNKKKIKISEAQEKSTKIHGNAPGAIQAEPGESICTSSITQAQIQQAAPLSVAFKRFNLELSNGPYASIDFTPNGRHALIGGRKGHVAAFDWKTGKLATELSLGEAVNDVHWLHNELLFAVAQRKHVFIYDSNGLEVHCLKGHTEVEKLEFLKWHFLLVSSSSKGGILRWQDVSTGTAIAQYKIGLGGCSGRAMRQNPQNAIIHVGHGNGVVSLWSPNIPKALVKVLCHRGPVQDVAVNRTGQYMATIGLDSKCMIWDMRNGYQPLFTGKSNPFYNARPSSSLAFSQTDMLAISNGCKVKIWKDVLVGGGRGQEDEEVKDGNCLKGSEAAAISAPYLTHNHTGHLIEHLEFCPFEDVLAIGSNRGVSTMLVPGAGEANFDSLHFNPFQTRRQRQEAEVKSLLEKLQPETIILDQSYFGKIEQQQQ